MLTDAEKFFLVVRRDAQFVVRETFVVLRSK